MFRMWDQTGEQKDIDKLLALCYIYCGLKPFVGLSDVLDDS